MSCYILTGHETNIGVVKMCLFRCPFDNKTCSVYTEQIINTCEAFQLRFGYPPLWESPQERCAACTDGCIRYTNYKKAKLYERQK